MKILSLTAMVSLTYQSVLAQQCLKDGEICGQDLSNSTSGSSACCSEWCYAGTCRPSKSLSKETKKCIDMMRLSPTSDISVCGNSPITIYGKLYCACGAHNEIVCPAFQEAYADFKEIQCNRLQTPEYQLSYLRNETEVVRIKEACKEVQGGLAKCDEFLEAFPKFAKCEARKPEMNDLCDACDGGKCRHVPAELQVGIFM